MAIIDGFPATSFDARDRKWVKDVAALPETTAASAGDVLTLDEEKNIEWAAPSGGGGEGLLVTFTKTFVDPLTTWTADASWNDVKNALDAGNSVTVKYSEYSAEDEWTLEWYYTGVYLLKQIPDTPTEENPITYLFFMDKEIPIAEIEMYDPDVDLEISYT